MFCKKCGTEINSTDKFCPKCGSQNSSPVYSASSARPTPKPAPKPVQAATKKKFPGWVAIVIAVVAIIIIIASVSGGSSSLEKDLVSTLPHEIRTYIWDGMAYNFIEDDRDEEDGSGTQHVLNVKNLTVDRHSTEGKSDTADCTIVMEDDYIEKTVYVTLYSMEYDTGWVVESWEEIQEPTVIPKAEPDIDYLKNVFDFKNITVTEDDLSLAEGKYTYSYTVNDSYTYVDYIGEVVLTADFSKSYNYSDDLCVYGWSYKMDDSSAVVLDWKVEGTWTLGISESDLSNEKGVVNISYTDAHSDSVYRSYYWDYGDSGNFTGSASYFEKNAYWALGGYADTNKYFDYSDHSGMYSATSTDGTIRPASVYLEIDISDGSYVATDYITMKFTADSIEAYLDGQECAYINHS